MGIITRQGISPFFKGWCFIFKEEKMVLTKTELRTTFKGILLAAGTWMIIIPFSNWLVEVSPIKNIAMIGVVMLLAVIMWE